jgi:hypothetical protein
MGVDSSLVDALRNERLAALDLVLAAAFDLGREFQVREHCEAVRALDCDAVRINFAEAPGLQLATAVVTTTAHRSESRYEWSDNDDATIDLVHKDAGAVAGWEFSHVCLAVFG